jgi:hypothetical protein
MRAEGVEPESVAPPQRLRPHGQASRILYMMIGAKIDARTDRD